MPIPDSFRARIRAALVSADLNEICENWSLPSKFAGTGQGFEHLVDCISADLQPLQGVGALLAWVAEAEDYEDRVVELGSPHVTLVTTWGPKSCRVRYESLAEAVKATMEDTAPPQQVTASPQQVSAALRHQLLKELDGCFCDDGRGDPECSRCLEIRKLLQLPLA